MMRKPHKLKDATMANQTKDSGKANTTCGCAPGDLSKAKVKETTFKNTKLNVVKLDWKEVYYTNCPLISASNVEGVSP